MFICATARKAGARPVTHDRSLHTFDLTGEHPVAEHGLLDSSPVTLVEP
jgi:hypothetical protein